MENSAETQVRTGSEMPDCESCEWQGGDVCFIESAVAFLCPGCRKDWDTYLTDVDSAIQALPVDDLIIDEMLADARVA